MHTITWTAVSIYFWPYSVDAIFKTAGFPHRIKFSLLQKIVHIFYFTSHPISQCHATFHSPSPHFFYTFSSPLRSSSSCIFTAPIYRLSILQRTASRLLQSPTNISLCIIFLFIRPAPPEPPAFPLDNPTLTR